MNVQHFDNLYEPIVFDDGARIERSKNTGYMAAVPRVARTGIQLYRGSELGKDSDEVIRVYRSEDQVFNKDSMMTFAHKPITNDHPPELVDSRNWRKYSVGVSGGEVARDGEFIRIPMTVMDADAVEQVMNGKAELSAGYSCDIKWEAGTTPDGQAYDAIQTNIRANHIAIVDKARGGDKLRIGDDTRDQPPHDGKKQETKMTDKQVVTMDVGGIMVEMASDTSAAVIKKEIGALQAKIAELEKELETATEDKKKAASDSATAITAKAKEIETKDAEIATLKKQLEDANKANSPAALDSRVKERAETIGKAKAIMGDKVVVDGKDEADIRRQVVSAKLGDVAKDWSDDAVKASFSTLTADVKTGAVHKVADAFSHPTVDGDREKLYADRDKALSDAWKGKTA